MASLRNQITVVGRVISDKQTTTLENGSLITRFSVDSSQESEENYPKKIGMFAWGNTADFINRFCDKGKRIAVSGKLVNRTYFNPSGVLRKFNELEVRQIIIL